MIAGVALIKHLDALVFPYFNLSIKIGTASL